MKVYGDVILEDKDSSSIDFRTLEHIIKRPYIHPKYRVTVLHANESVNYIIPDEDIVNDGISFTEEYQNGQRRNITLQLINIDGKYTPSINGIWLSTKFKFEIGVDINSTTIWFPKGVYILGDITVSHNSSDKTVTYQLKDKYALFEGKMGTLEEAYEIEVGSNIEDAIKGILNFDSGNGYILDYKPLIFDPAFIGKKTQNTIRVDEGGNLGAVIDALATQLSAEYYYNNVGNLCFYPINETIDDSSKPIIWVFEKFTRELHNLSLNYKNEDVINVVNVVGDNIDNGVFAASASNENIASPICIQQIGRRAAPKYTSPNIWNNELANDLARYYLRQNSFISVDFSCNVGFNPILTVNNICEVENDFIGLKREKLLITSISYSSSDGLMSLKLCNTTELPFI